MKKIKIISLICIILVVICFVIFIQAGETNNAVVSIGTSDKFSKAEINDAVKCVERKFKDFNGCNLTKLWYDEKQSNSAVEEYLKDRKGLVNSADAENVIVLLSNFNVNFLGGDQGFNPNTTYSDWNWILIRDSKTGKWKVDEWGY